MDQREASLPVTFVSSSAVSTDASSVDIMSRGYLASSSALDTSGKLFDGACWTVFLLFVPICLMNYGVVLYNGQCTSMSQNEHIRLVHVWREVSMPDSTGFHTDHFSISETLMMLTDCVHKWQFTAVSHHAYPSRQQWCNDITLTSVHLYVCRD